MRVIFAMTGNPPLSALGHTHNETACHETLGKVDDWKFKDVVQRQQLLTDVFQNLRLVYSIFILT